jgi:ABC-2 type transport system ATP-binding protein
MLINHGTLALDGTVDDLRSDERRVVVDFHEPPELDDAHRACLSSVQGARLVFHVDSRVPEFVAELAGRYRVRDLVVEFPPIEEMLARIYEKRP